MYAENVVTVAAIMRVSRLAYTGIIQGPLLYINFGQRLAVEHRTRLRPA